MNSNGVLRHHLIIHHETMSNTQPGFSQCNIGLLTWHSPITEYFVSPFDHTSNYTDLKRCNKGLYYA